MPVIVTSKKQMQQGWKEVAGWGTASAVLKHYHTEKDGCGNTDFGVALKATLQSGMYQLHYNYGGGEENLWYNSDVNSHRSIKLRTGSKFICIKYDDGSTDEMEVARFFHLENAEYAEWWALSQSPQAPPIP